MILLLLILQTILLSKVSADRQNEMNILSKAAVMVSDNQDMSKAINDGNKKSCFDIQNNLVKWAVFDLQNIYEVQKVVLWNGNYKNNRPINIYIGREFSPSSFHKQIAHYQACQTGIQQNENKMEIKCMGGSENTGQFVALVKGDYLSSSNNEDMVLCDVEAYGNVIPSRAAKARPQIPSETLPPISANLFPAIKEIRQNVPSIKIPNYSTSVVYVNDNCEPIIFDKDSKSAFSIVCKTDDGKGRLVMFGKDNFFNIDVQTPGMKTFKTNLYKWLSPQSANPKVVDTQSLNSLNDLKQNVKQGDIINVNVWAPTPKDVLQELKTMLLKGNIAVVVDHTFWVETTKEARKSYLEILNIFNADFSSTFLNEAEKTLSFSMNDINDDLLGIDQKLERMAKNHDYFVRNGKGVGNMLDSIHPTLLSKSKARPFIEQIAKKYVEYIKSMCPSKANPIIDKTDREIIEAFGNIIRSQMLANSNYKAPCVEVYPGDFASPPTKKSVTVSLEGQTPETLNPIGYYLEPGSTLEYKTSAIQGEWTISIGCHSDKLDKERPEWYRYPNIYINKISIQDSGSVYSPFGGIIWLSNSKSKETITITLKNVVPSPFFNLRDKSSVSQWNSQKSNPGLWAIIAGDNSMICVESKLIRSFDGQFLSDLMINHWDMVVKMDFALKSENWKDKKHEIIVMDVMPSVGEAHSGYPIVAFDYWFDNLFNLKTIQSGGSWGVCHEIGHNMQVSDWTFNGVVEVTNNVFCFYNFEKLWNVPYYGSKTVKFFRDYDRAAEVKKFLDSGANFKVWNNEPFTALLIYAQMANNFGWGFYNKVFTFYKNANLNLGKDDDKVNMWINVTSTISKQNLIPMFDFWGFPINNNLKQSLSQLPCFFPDDFFKELSDTRNKYIKSKYSSCSSKSTFFEDFPVGNFKGELRTNFIKSIK